MNTIDKPTQEMLDILKEFIDKMEKTVIPEIIENIKERQRFAEIARRVFIT